MASTYIQKTFSTTGTSRQKFTLSMWIKRGSGLGAEQMLCECYSGSSAKDEIWLQSNDTINFVKTDGGGLATTTSAVFRDTCSWYHLVISADSTQGSNANRIKIYINGVQQTLGQQDTIPQNANFQFGASGANLTFGRRNAGDWYFNGSMTHVHMIDGTAYDASAFGETDTTTGEWEAKTSPSVTYGTNGFLILKDGNTITDQSSNSNNFTLGGGTLTDLKDNPDNNFATLNPLAKGVNVTLTNCNLQFTSNNRYGTVGTLGVSSGKWYWEVKAVDVGSDIQVGIFQDGGNIGHPNQELGGTSQGWSVISIGGNKFNNSSQASYGSAFSDGDILMVALDMDNGKWYMGKNNSWFNSGNPATSANPAHTGITGTIFPAITTYTESESGSINYQFNFGNGIFGTTAITTNSGNGYSGAEGSSKFNYQPPTGYSALNTKGLNE